MQLTAAASVRTLLAAFLFSSHSLAAYFVPPTQWAQDAIRLDNLTVWVYGGQTLTVFGTRQLYALDISKPFSSTNPPWTDYSSESGLVAPASAFVTLFPSADRQGFYAFQGGATGWTSTAFALYNTSIRSWSTPAFIGTAPSPREMSPVAYSTFNNNNNVYIYGGATTVTFPSNVQEFNTQTSAFLNLTTTGVNVPARFGHTATLLPTGQIVIIGGIIATPSGTTYILTWAPMLNIPVYDTTTGAWSTPSVTVAAGSTTPPLRRLHNANLAADGYTIIILCGDTPTPVNDGTSSVTFSFDTQYKNALNDFFSLDTRAFVYTEKTFVGLAPTARSGPSSVLVNNQLIVFFGQTPTGAFLSDLFIVDTNLWTVQSTFTPANYISSTTNSTTMTATASASASASATPASAGGGSSIGTGAIIGIAIAGVAIAAGVGAFVFYTQSKRKQPVTGPRAAEAYPFVTQYPPTSQYQPPPPPAPEAQPQYYDQSAALIAPRPDQYGGYNQTQYYSQDGQHAGPHQPQAGNSYYQAPSPGPNADAAGGINTYYPVSYPSATAQQYSELSNAASHPPPSSLSTAQAPYESKPDNSVGVDSAFAAARLQSYLPTYIATKPDSVEGYQLLKPEAVEVPFESSPIELSSVDSSSDLASVEPSHVELSHTEPSS
ncbi:hypothetical protein BC937DRAFT_87454 [Endogone sp. FLAS-F59071]|nr:hypothetical protein BC937DRAFT_87454 [Endogone sp. FLAS-F59071]|eukprot:RUS19447.1 hypothetical protein BC937DRAFT_87454 [Endogone sp. FLAS-F59071]